MRSKAMSEWMYNEMQRLSMKFERYKPSCSGYNRMQSIRLSKSVTHMLNNPLPVGHQIGSIRHSSRAASDKNNNSHTNSSSSQHITHNHTASLRHQPKGVLSRSESEWEEVYPTINFSHAGGTAACDLNGNSESFEKARKFTYYRSCSTRLT